jgi:hypothetical protein
MFVKKARIVAILGWIIPETLAMAPLSFVAGKLDLHRFFLADQVVVRIAWRRAAPPDSDRGSFDDYLLQFYPYTSAPADSGGCHYHVMRIRLRARRLSGSMHYGVSQTLFPRCRHWHCRC